MDYQTIATTYQTIVESPAFIPVATAAVGLLLGYGAGKMAGPSSGFREKEFKFQQNKLAAKVKADEYTHTEEMANISAQPGLEKIRQDGKTAKFAQDLEYKKQVISQFPAVVGIINTWQKDQYAPFLAKCAEVKEKRGEYIRGELDKFVKSSDYDNIGELIDNEGISDLMEELDNASMSLFENPTKPKLPQVLDDLLGDI